MIKVVFGWSDNAERTAHDCHRHYLDVHAPLAVAAFKDVAGFVSLKYNRVRRYFVNDYEDPTPIDCEPEMDAFIELVFASAEHFSDAFGRPEMDWLRADNRNIMDVNRKASVRVYEVEEFQILSADPAPTPQSEHP